MIRPATVHDVPRISEIINSHAEFGRMLFKSFAQLYEDLRDFAVVERDGRVVGCVGLTIIWADLAEVRSLAPCLEGAADDGSCCERTVALYREKLARIDAQVRTLTGLRHRIVERMAALEPCAAPVPISSTNPGAGASPRVQTRRSA